MFKLKHLILSLVASAGILVVSSSSAHAATINVNTLDDTDIQDDGACSLREAINNINAGSDTTDGGGGGDCPAGDGVDDTVVLPSGTMTLNLHLPEITESIAITGQGMGTTIIDGDGAYGALSVNGSSTPIDSFTVADLTITGYQAAGISVFGTDTVVNISRVEIDGNNMIASGSFPILAGIVCSGSGELNINSVYVHDISSTTDGSGVLAIGIAGQQNSVTDVSIANSTISNLSAAAGTGSTQGIAFQMGVLDGSSTPATITAELANNTITDLSSANSGAQAVGAFGFVEDGDSNLNIVSTNNTFSHLHGTSETIDSSGILFIAASTNEEDTFNVSYQSVNTVYADSTSDGTVNNTCMTVDGNPFISGSGTNTFTLSSLGGNLTDDNTCSSYFTEPTDQNNVTNLASTLGALGDYGGYVPTIPLLEGSPAIDAGVTVAGLTSDARGVSRPLGLAYDSGAYESPYTQAEDTEGASLAETGGPVGLLIVLGTVLVGSSLVLQKLRST
ncbi:CSLREA domain-containing protein [Candidatus Saccharibacteria bacterium]|nr:CSLREA domain-containing protein [Candidatus Saccharibacteria bacterium]